MSVSPVHKDAFDTTVMLKAAIGAWTGLTAIGGFALYAAGYLALRFHLAVLGVATDLSVVDERYLFMGARCLIYLVSTLPSILMVGVVTGVLLWAPWRILPAKIRARFGIGLLRPHLAAPIGIVVALVAIQGFMKQCYFFVDLLLAERLPAEPLFLVHLLMGTGSLRLPEYFVILVASCLMPMASLAVLSKQVDLSPVLVVARGVLAILVSVQLLLLPINYGVLVVDKSLARVTAAGPRVAGPGETIWLVWEGGSGVTFLIANDDTRRRSLLTEARDKAIPIEVVAMDAIFPTLFAPVDQLRRAPSREKK